MPTKIIKPADSLFSISAFILTALSTHDMNVDELFDKVNDIYYKNIPLEKLLLGLNFLYITDKIELNNEIITIKI